MKAAFSALDEVDRLTQDDLQLLEPDEWVEIARRRDFIRDASAETKSLVRVRINKAFATNDEPDESDDGDPGEPADETSLQIDQGWNITWQFEYMCRGWNLYEPASADGTRKPIPFTRENREKFVRLNGTALWGQMLIRGGGIEPRKKLEGKVDPDTGKPLTFPGHAEDAAGGLGRQADVAVADPSGSV